MKDLFLLLSIAGMAFGQATNVPVCNGFDVSGVPINTTTSSQNCTDYFGSPNWANSPLPTGTITGYTLVAGGSGYTAPQATVTDLAQPAILAFTFTLAASDVTGGVITSISGGTGLAGYMIPQVTITDPTGSGAMATAVLGGPFSGGMHKFVDPLVDLKTLIAKADATTFSGSDYYEIALVQYSQQMHSDLAPTTLRGYVQFKTGSMGCAAANQVSPPSYLGPVILAQKNRPVRVKFTNCLPAGAGGALFVPMDSTYMGADPRYTQNRATLHLHGGATPWISDGTPHQWTVPVGEAGGVQKGDSVAYVPDMFFDSMGKVTPVPQCSATVTTGCYPNAVPPGLTNNPGQGALTFFWTNDQGARLMFYHDHAYGITRLNVYVGEAAGYVLVDPVEEDSLAAGTAPGTAGTSADLGHFIPLVIQDKTFIPSSSQLDAQDPTWAANFGLTPGTAKPGDLWFPHVYVPNQNPADPTASNAFGHWDYGPWFFPPQTTLTAASPTTAVTVPCTSSAFPGQVLDTTICPTCGCPITPNPSGTPEAFMDTPVVNGVAYPSLHVAPAAYRFKILTAGNDRSLNLSWFVADTTGKDVSMLPAAPPTQGSSLPLCTAVNPVAVPALGLGLVGALLDNSGNPLNGTGLPANCWPNYGTLQGIPAPQTMWAADGRGGGVPDPRTAGPPWIQIGSEGGLLPAPVVIPATPVNYELNARSITIGSVAMHGLWLGPAERADVIVDFSKFAGKTLILYNDAAAPAPASDSRLDYFSGDGDQTPIGGAPNTQPGYGPNIRTVMQVVVDGSSPNTVPFSLNALKSAFASTATTAGVFAATQPTIIVPEAAYNSAYKATYKNTYAGISDNNLTFTPIAPQIFDQACPATAPATCAVMDQKAIQELFTLDYGRMNATLGVELPLTNFQNQTTIPYGYVDWPTEIIQQGQTQLWKITHNGVDTHFIHFHLFNVQVINRVGWDGSMRQPDANEMGWKDTVRMNPLEDIVVALQPITPAIPFPVPDSIRAMDVAMMGPGTDSNISGLDPNTGNATVSRVNQPVNFGWEYVWHCHILGHEENDMMRPIIFEVPPPAPTNLAASSTAPPNVVLQWTDNSASETSFTVQRSTTTGFLPADAGYASFTVNAGNSTGFITKGYGGLVTFSDTTAAAGTTYYYRVQANDDLTPQSPNPVPFVTVPLSSPWSNVVSLTSALLPPSVTFTGAPPSAAYNTTFTVTATTNASTVPTITAGSGSVCTVSAVTGTSANASAIVTMTSGTGSCSLTAVWAADTTFLTASLTQATNAVLATPTVAFTGAPATATNGTPFTVTATTNAGVAPTMAGNTVCSVGAVTGTSPATATVTMSSGTGTCSVTANWPATLNYASSSLIQSTTAGLATPTVTFTGAPTNQAYSSSFSVTATTNAGVMPTITPAGVCSATGVTGTAGNATATITMNSGTGTCSLTASWPATASYAAASKTQSTAATQLGSTTSITSNTPNPSVVGQAVSVSVRVTGTGLAAPAGTVTVTATTGESCTTATLSSGVGSCTLNFTSAGSRTLTALYNGDANYGTSTSAAASQSVGDFSVGITPTSQSITGGDKARYTITLTPISGFTGSVTLGCSSSPALPAGYTCTLSSTTVSLNGGTQKVTVTVNTAKGTAGTYTLTLTGTNSYTGGTLVRTVPATLTTKK